MGGGQLFADDYKNIRLPSNSHLGHFRQYHSTLRHHKKQTHQDSDESFDSEYGGRRSGIPSDTPMGVSYLRFFSKLSTWRNWL